MMMLNSVEIRGNWKEATGVFLFLLFMALQQGGGNYLRNTSSNGYFNRTYFSTPTWSHSVSEVRHKRKKRMDKSLLKLLWISGREGCIKRHKNRFFLSLKT